VIVNEENEKRLRTVVNDKKSSVFTAMNEKGNNFLRERERNFRWEVGVDVDQNEARGCLNTKVADLPLRQNWLHTRGDLRDIKVLDFHELVEGIVGPHEEDDLPFDRGDHENGSPGSDCKRDELDQKKKRKKRKEKNCKKKEKVYRLSSESSIWSL